MRLFSCSLLVLFLVSSFPLAGDNGILSISQEDTHITVSSKGEGFDLWIRKKTGMGSVLLTESSSDPNQRQASFALRAYKYHPTNGDEMRLLDGKPLGKAQNLYFLVDSSPEWSPVLNAAAFHIFVPFSVTYGYPWSREGQLHLGRGSWLNIRAFAKPFADYSGSYRDNPFLLASRDLPREDTPKNTNTDFLSVSGDAEALAHIGAILDEVSSSSVDLALVLDTTISMKDDLQTVRRSLVPLIKDKVSSFAQFRVGIVLYRDYKEVYLTQVIPFGTSLRELQKRLNKVTVAGGRDLAEAVYEGIYAAIDQLVWEAPTRLLIQVGDGLPHATPRGTITKETVTRAAKERAIQIHSILLPTKRR